CVLGGLCDGRTPSVEPPVVEGAPPVPMEVRNWVIQLRGTEPDRTPPAVQTYPANGATEVYQDAVIKVFFSEPVTGVSPSSFVLTGPDGAVIPAFVDQIGDGAWGLFPDQVSRAQSQTYTVHLKAGICDFQRNCNTPAATWSFTTAAERTGGEGNTAIPLGFPASRPPADVAPAVRSVERAADGSVVVTFSEAVMNVTPRTFQVGSCTVPQPLAGKLASDPQGLHWTFRPAQPLPADGLCVTVADAVYDLQGRPLGQPFRQRLASR